MKIAIVGSRNAHIENLERYIPPKCTEIVSGGAIGIDTCAAHYARSNGLPLTEFLPEYHKYGRHAPLIRNRQIVDYADEVVAFILNDSHGTKYVIDYCKKVAKPCTVIFLD